MKMTVSFFRLGPHMKKVIKSILERISVGITLILLLYIIGMQIFPQKVTDIIGYRFYAVVTGSMEPVIPAGSLVLSKTIKEDTILKPNTIITFQANRLGDEITLTHYLKMVEQDETGQERYYTQGNTAQEYDGYKTYRKDISGTYIWHVPYVGKVIQFLRSPFALLEFIIIGIVLLVQFIIGKRFDYEERLDIGIAYTTKLRLQKVVIRKYKKAIRISGLLYNPAKESIPPCNMKIELFNEEKEMVDSNMWELPELSGKIKIQWELETDSDKEVDDYIIKLLPMENENIQ